MRIATVAEHARAAIVMIAAASALLASLLTWPAIVPARSRDIPATTSLPSLAPARVCADDSLLLLCTSSPADLEVRDLARVESALGR